MSVAEKPAPDDAHQGRFLRLPSWLDPTSSSVGQMLQGKLARTRSLLQMTQQRTDLDAEDRRVIALCEERLGEAAPCIQKAPRKPFRYWELIHQADELLLLVIPESMLPAEALEVRERFERTIQDRDIRRIWLGAEGGSPGPLLQTVERLTAAVTPERARGENHLQLAADRRILQRALHLVNEKIDKGYWQASINATVQVLSGLLLMVLFVVGIAYSFDWIALPEDRARPGLLEQWPALPVNLALLGAAGAIVANMITRRSFPISTGAAGRFIVYYVLVKPVIGGFAGVFVYLLEKSELIFRVGEPGRAGWAIQIPAVTPQQEAFVLGLLAVVAGFTAEKFLVGTIDKVLGRLLKESDKVSQAPSGGGPGAAEEAKV